MSNKFKSGEVGGLVDVMVSAVIVLWFCDCCVSIVVCTCECFALEHIDFVAFIH